MPQHEKKHCPRCQTEFECKTGSILLCQCAGVNLSELQLEYINSEYDDCLCLACLQALARECNNIPQPGGQPNTQANGNKGVMPDE